MTGPDISLPGNDPITEKLGSDKLGEQGDDFYQALMQAHESLSLEQSTRLNARLVLMMANQIGDLKVLKLLLHAAGGAGSNQSSKS